MVAQLFGQADRVFITGIPVWIPAGLQTLYKELGGSDRGSAPSSAIRPGGDAYFHSPTADQ